MIFHSHVKIATTIYETLDPNDHIWISKRAFIKGANAPDGFSYRFKGKHILNHSAGFFESLVNETLNSYKPRHYFGHLLGEIIHFISDYACAFHANPNYNHMYVHPVHLWYEVTLHQKLKKAPVNITPVEGLSLMNLDEKLRAYTETYHSGKYDQHQDIIDAYNWSYSVFHLVMEAYKRKFMHNQASSKLKIAIFTDTYLPQINGVSNTLYEYSKYLETERVQYLLISPKVNDDDAHHPFVKRLASMKFWFYKEARMAFSRHKKLAKVLDDFEPNMIHLMTEFNVGHMGLKYAKKNKIPVVSNYSSHFTLFLKHMKLGFFIRPLERYIHYFHTKAKLTTTPSLESKTFLKTLGVDDVHIFSRGIDTIKFSSSKRSLSLRESWGVKDQLVFLSVSRISGEKNLDLLFDSFIKLDQKYPSQSKLVITGDGPLLKDYQKKYPFAIYTGYQTGEDLAEIYASADVFAFPSPTETLGNVVLEAKASGLPPIVVNRGGVTSNVDDEITGLITDIDHPDTFLYAMERFILNPGLIERFKYEISHEVELKSWPEVFSDLLSVYSKMMESASS